MIVVYFVNIHQVWLSYVNQDKAWYNALISMPRSGRRKQAPHLQK